MQGSAGQGEVPITPPPGYEHKAREGGPRRILARMRRDGWLCEETRQVHA